MESGFYRGVVEGMGCGVMTIDATGRILTLNELGRQILELSGPAEGRLCAEVLAQHPRLSEILLGSFACATLPSRAELELRTRDDRGRTIGFSMSRIRVEAGADVGFAFFFKDLTQVERAEEQERLRDRLAALGGMAAQMAHEIRNPIASIAVSAQLLRRRLEAAGDSTAPADRIVAEVARVERTIADCLEYVRPMSPALKPHALRGLLESAMNDVRRMERAAGVVMDLDCGEGLGDLSCDGLRLREMFRNLLINAVEAMDGSGKVVVEARLEDGHAVVRLADTGPGVPEDLRDRIFYPFFTTKTKGTGIGLAMARRIAEVHRGVLDVENGAAGGAVFTVRLPVGPGEPAVPATPAGILPPHVTTAASP